jgi:Zn-dependent peptidase ImmA (M78 family)/DNA-binding XRE family transcriptional regulator
MSDLAERVGLTRQAISAYEMGQNSPSPENLRSLAKALDVPETFLTLPFYKEEEKRQSAVNFRTLASSTARDRDQANVYITWLCGFTSFLSTYVELPPVNLPAFDISDFTRLQNYEIEEFAQNTRRFFGLGDGPISNLTTLLENNGVVTSRLPLAPGMDGFSTWFSNKPFICISDSANYFRSRFDLAHERAHLLLHPALTQEDLERDKQMLKLVEDQAHRFAGAFLLPEKTFATEIYALDLAELISLKKRWGVSIQAILMRLAALNIISESQKTRLFVRLSSQGMRRKEPLDRDYAAERGKLFDHVAEFLNSKNILMSGEFVLRSRFPTAFAQCLVSMQESSHKIPENVIPFKSKSV